MRFKASILQLAICITAPVVLHAQTNYLANNTILIVRHAEKSPESGIELTPQGRLRAQMYAKYFVPFHDGGFDVKIDSLYAGADSKNSIRPRLTLEPLSQAMGLPLHHDIGTKDTDSMVAELRTHPHGQHTLISWRHGEIPNLIKAFGGPANLIPNEKWPDEVYDWVIVLMMDPNGSVSSAKLIHENLNVPKN